MTDNMKGRNGVAVRERWQVEGRDEAVGMEAAVTVFKQLVS